MSTTTTDPSRLGTCPFCSNDIVTGDVIIEYKFDRQRSVYAEYPECGDVTKDTEACPACGGNTISQFYIR